VLRQKRERAVQNGRSTCSPTALRKGIAHFVSRKRELEVSLNVGEAFKDSPHGAETRALIRAVGHCLKMNVKKKTIKINLWQAPEAVFEGHFMQCHVGGQTSEGVSAFTNGISRHSTGLAKNVGGNESGFAQLARLQRKACQLADGKFWKKGDHFAHFPSA